MEPGGTACPLRLRDGRFPITPCTGSWPGGPTKLFSKGSEFAVGWNQSLIPTTYWNSQARSWFTSQRAFCFSLSLSSLVFLTLCRRIERRMPSIPAIRRAQAVRKGRFPVNSLDTWALLTPCFSASTCCVHVRFSSSSKIMFLRLQSLPTPVK